MNLYVTSLISMQLFIMIFISQAMAQTNWTKYEENPVLNLGSSGSWDDNAVSWPFVIYDGTQYVMWYTGNPGISYIDGQIGRAASPDGIDWTKYEGNPVITLGSNDEWDDYRIDAGPVMFDESGYRMWYTGYDGAIWRIGLASSQDGIDWTKFEGNPIMNPGSMLSWDDEGVAVSAVLLDEATYKMWYVGFDGSSFRVGYATSQDGIIWTKNEGNPVMDIGETGSWDALDIQHAYVILNGDLYKMWYHGRDADNYFRTGYATSSDGITWSKYEHNPVLDREIGSVWESQDATVGSVILRENVYRMWYMGRVGAVGKIGYAYDSLFTAIEDFAEDMPKSYALSQNYPNPFNPSTKINFSLPKPEIVKIEIYNIIGQKIKTLLNMPMPAGYHEVEYNGQNLSSGVYLYRIEVADPARRTGTWQDVKKMVYIK